MADAQINQCAAITTQTDAQAIVSALHQREVSYEDLLDTDSIINEIQTRKDFVPTYGLAKAKVHAKADVLATIHCAVQIAESPSIAPRIRAKSYVLLADLWGMMAAYYTSNMLFMKKVSYGEQAYFALKKATRLDPTYDMGWICYADMINAFSNRSEPERMIIESGLAINIEAEKNYGINGLRSLPKTDRIQKHIDMLSSRKKT